MDDYERLPALKKLPKEPEDAVQQSERAAPLVLDMVESSDLYGTPIPPRMRSPLEICPENFTLDNVMRVIEMHNVHLDVVNTVTHRERFVDEKTYEYFKRFQENQSALAFIQLQATSEFLRSYFSSPGANQSLLKKVKDMDALPEHFSRLQ